MSADSLSTLDTALEEYRQNREGIRSSQRERVAALAFAVTVLGGLLGALLDQGPPRSGEAFRVEREGPTSAQTLVYRADEQCRSESAA